MGGRKDVCGAKLGTSFEATRWLSLDVCGLVGVTLSFSIHIFAAGVNLCHLISGSLISTAVFILLYVPAVLLALASLFMAWTSDPGCVPMGARPLVTVRPASSMTVGGGGSNSGGNSSRTRALRRCHKCNDNFKPARAHHDSVTGRCIVKFDHFCPWVGNAVGATNHKFFVLFVGYTMLSCLFSSFLMILKARSCGYPSPLLNQITGKADKNETPDDSAECTGWNESYLGLALLVISVVFFLFTSCMFVEQVEAIKTNASKIARMKMSVGQAGTELSRVTEEFNEMFGGVSNKVALHWFIPSPVEFPNAMEKIVLGYEWDETFDAVPYEEPNRDDLEAGTSSSTTLSRIELTSVPSTTAPNASNGSLRDIGNENSSTNSLAGLDRPQLVKRNSRDHDSEESLRRGTLT
mmetsp:Transcript_13181/g.37064  ORF Transcript_13181/g.37064 Transcript_13181/m.37064 type:complete len:408 (-) Transcript_13181:2502-3725(-)